jgi:hypothetical protein
MFDFPKALAIWARQTASECCVRATLVWPDLLISIHELQLTTSMAIETAGQKAAKVTKIRIENTSTLKLPKDTEATINKVLDFLPVEQYRGVERIKLVDFINDPRLKNMDVPMKGDLPGLYHPRVQNQAPWFELSMAALLQPTEGFVKKFMAKSSFKGNIAGLIFSLVGQHYYLTLRHSVKRTSLEPQIRQYAEKNLKVWSEKQNEGSIRAKIFKPFRPYLERWAKWLNKKAAAQKS